MAAAPVSVVSWERGNGGGRRRGWDDFKVASSKETTDA